MAEEEHLEKAASVAAVDVVVVDALVDTEQLLLLLLLCY